MGSEGREGQPSVLVPHELLPRPPQLEERADVLLLLQVAGEGGWNPWRTEWKHCGLSEQWEG